MADIANGTLPLPHYFAFAKPLATSVAELLRHALGTKFEAIKFELTHVLLVALLLACLAVVQSIREYSSTLHSLQHNVSHIKRSIDTQGESAYASNREGADIRRSASMESAT